jgi:hypothetical protein
MIIKTVTKYVGSVVLTLLFIPYVVAGQTGGCSAVHANAPDVRGFRLGMTIAQLQRRHPKFKPNRPDVYGYIGQSLWFLQDVAEMSEADREGLSGLELAFLDGKLIDVLVKYDGFIEFGDISLFTQTIASKLGLPPETEWESIKHPPSRRLVCSTFTVVTQLLPKVSKYELETQSLRLFDQNAFEVLEKRKKEKPEQDRRTFKP